MAPEPVTKQAIFVIPTSVITKVDVGRVLREVEALEGFLQQSAIRQPGTQPKLPKTSKLLDDVVTLNKVNILIEAECKHLRGLLKEIYLNAPVMHMSFGADPSPSFTAKLITRMRENIHPLVLLQIGLQPTIGAGCMVRTTNKYFDFSLRNRFRDKRNLLASALSGNNG